MGDPKWPWVSTLKWSNFVIWGTPILGKPPCRYHESMVIPGNRQGLPRTEACTSQAPVLPQVRPSLKAALCLKSWWIPWGNPPGLFGLIKTRISSNKMNKNTAVVSWFMQSEILGEIMGKPTISEVWESNVPFKNGEMRGKVLIGSLFGDPPYS